MADLQTMCRLLQGFCASGAAAARTALYDPRRDRQMDVLDYSRRWIGDRMAMPFAIISTCIGVGGNVWGALAAWSLHSYPQGATVHTMGLESLLFLQAMLTALIGVGFGLASLARGRGRVGLILFACAGMHLSLTPLLVSNAVLDHVMNSHALVAEP